MRKLLGVCSAILGLGCAMLTAIAISDLVGGSDTEPGVLVGLLIFFGGLTAMSGAGAFRLLRERRAVTPSPEPSAAPASGLDLELEAKIVALASGHEGRLTPPEVALACGVSLDRATAELDRLVGRGYAELLVSSSGATVYALKGILSAQEKAEAAEVLAARR